MLPDKRIALRERHQGAFLQHFSFCQGSPDFRVVLHGVNATVHIKRSIRRGSAQVDEREPKVFVTIGSQGLGDLGQQIRPLGIG